MNWALEPAGVGTINLPEREGAALLAPYLLLAGNAPLIGLEIYANPVWGPLIGLQRPVQPLALIFCSAPGSELLLPDEALSGGGGLDLIRT